MSRKKPGSDAAASQEQLKLLLREDSARTAESRDAMRRRGDEAWKAPVSLPTAESISMLMQNLARTNRVLNETNKARKTAKTRALGGMKSRAAREQRNRVVAARNRARVRRCAADEMGIKETARHLGLNVKTVRKYWSSKEEPD
jgi:DNA-binding CsgD family transcriptional regulator